VKIVGNAKTFTMMSQFFNFEIESRKIVIKEGDTINTGRHNFTFVMAPMVHWPEAMVTYDTTDKILYSADAFGSFGAMDGNIFADECDFENKWLDDARRYYTNIVGKYGVQVQSLLKKASTLEISMICPLHGPIWRENLGFIIDKYMKWGSYTPEKKSALIVYGSVHGHTENTADIFANSLGEKGVKEIAVYNASTTHFSTIIAECFKYSHIVFACATYNMSLFPPMQVVLHELAEHNLQNRTFAFIENGTWAPVAAKLMQECVDKLKNNKIIEQKVTIKSALNEQSCAELEKLADAVASDINAL
ncbi:MAG: FprA family A-type flavoprotein, partial [Clostridia bacterium]|nr:FprA family A-type flavoprotein [Clostridia bacterium]